MFVHVVSLFGAEKLLLGFYRKNNHMTLVCAATSLVFAATRFGSHQTLAPASLKLGHDVDVLTPGLQFTDGCILMKSQTLLCRSTCLLNDTIVHYSES